MTWTFRAEAVEREKEKRQDEWFSFLQSAEILASVIFSIASRVLQLSFLRLASTIFWLQSFHLEVGRAHAKPATARDNRSSQPGTMDDRLREPGGQTSQNLTGQDVSDIQL